MLWGETQFRQQFIVDKEGYIFNTDLGQIFVNGLTLGKLEVKLLKRLSKVYSSLNPQKGSPTTFLDISIGDLRPLRVIVLGEVVQPGAYTVAPTTTLFSSLYYFNGPSQNGSLRNIQLIRNGEIINTIDFYEYLLNGNSKGDVRLQLDDIIFIPKRGKSVTILGEVNKNANFEIKENETLSNLIEIAGGLKSTAYLERSQIDRIIPFEDREIFWSDRIIIDINLDSIVHHNKSIDLVDGDLIKIFPIKDIHLNDIYIKGSSVKMPGKYELTDSMSVSDLVSKAGGISENSYLKKANIIRSNVGDFNNELISINLEKALGNDPDHNIQLKWKDTLKIFNTRDFIPSYFVTLKGHVKNPGKFFLFEDMTVYDLLFQHGGFLDNEWNEKTFTGRVDISRLTSNGTTRKNIEIDLFKIIQNPNVEENVALEPQDLVTVYPNKYFFPDYTIMINGSVKSPGQYKLKKEMTIKDLILEAGGLSNDLQNYRVEIARVDPSNDKEKKYADIILFEINEGSYSIESYIVRNKNKIQNETENFILQKYDIVSVRPNPNFKFQKIINITGAINFPGDYSLSNENESIKDIFERGGGLRNNAFLEGIKFYRNQKEIKVDIQSLINKKRSKNNFLLKDNDKIFIPQKPQLILVKGEVYNPGLIKYLKNKKINYYLKNSGGLTSDADEKNILCIYPNGKTINRKYSRIFDIKVPDGSTIIVETKKEEEPFDKTEFFKEFASIIADFTQVVALFLVTINQ
jgi:polysaccharide biosynthesis/export protein